MSGSSLLTAVTAKLTTTQSLLGSEAGNYASGATKISVIHRRPILSIPPASTALDHRTCPYASHAPSEGKKTATQAPQSERKSPASIDSMERKKAPLLMKRSLSADQLNMFGPVPTKRPFPVQIWFNQSKVRRLPVATAYWLDSPLHDSMTFVYTKLLEASQAYRYLQLQSKPRKYLHLTGGGIQTINAPVRKPEATIPAMMVKLGAQLVKKTANGKLPPPPPLISLRPKLKILMRNAPPQQEHPLELCKRRKPSDTNESSRVSTTTTTTSTTTSVMESATVQPLDLASGSSAKRKRVQMAPLALMAKSEPLNLATDSSSSGFLPNYKDNFRRRLVLVLQVLLGKKKLLNLGHPHVIVDEILTRILKRAGVVPAKSIDVRQNWLKFLRLCVKNEDAWKSEGWDRKTPEAILDEIYIQDVIPIIRKSESSSSLSEKCLSPEELDVKPKLNQIISS